MCLDAYWRPSTFSCTLMAKACGLGFPYNCEIVWLKCFTIVSNSIAFVNQGLFCHHPASIKWDQMGFFITNVFLPNSYFHLIPLKSKPDYTWHTEQICNHVLNRQSLWILGPTIKNYRILDRILEREKETIRIKPKNYENFFIAIKKTSIN